MTTAYLFILFMAFVRWGFSSYIKTIHVLTCYWYGLYLWHLISTLWDCSQYFVWCSYAYSADESTQKSVYMVVPTLSDIYCDLLR